MFCETALLVELWLTCFLFVESTEPKTEVPKIEPPKIAESKTEEQIEPTTTNENIVEVEQAEEEKKQEAQIMDGIWDNFKTCKAANLDTESTDTNTDEECTYYDVEFLRSVIMAEHDYCITCKDLKTDDDLVECDLEINRPGNLMPVFVKSLLRTGISFLSPVFFLPDWNVQFAQQRRFA